MARVIPLSSKAKNRLANVMGSDPNVVVERREGNKVFLVSTNGQWCAWVDLANDPNWDVVLG